MKKLLLCCTDLMLKQFMLPHVHYLSENGYEVDLACSEVGGKIKELRNLLNGYVNKFYVVRLVRSPFSIDNINGYRDIKRIVNHSFYDVIWTNEPVMGVTTRLAARTARMRGTKVVYMVHGFHFYQGAPILNWMLYYPVERLCSRFCDEIVTMNDEDYQRAQTFHSNSVQKIFGVGVSLENFSPNREIRSRYRSRLLLNDESIMLLNVAELTKRKNQQVLLEAMYLLKNPQIKLFICGVGEEEKRLKKQVLDFGLQEQVHFLGYRNDIPALCCAADIFVLTSRQEGLPKAIMEAMASGLPVICSAIRGNIDLIKNGKDGYAVQNDAKSVAKALNKLVRDSSLRRKMGAYNIDAVKKYGEENAKKAILDLLQRNM